MKVLQVYTQDRGAANGEEVVVRQTAALLGRHGVQPQLLVRPSRDAAGSWIGKARAFCSSVCSPSAFQQLKRLLSRDRPDVVHIHNLYPLLSPSILIACRRAGVPVVMSVHNQHLTCPRADHLHRGTLCERCRGGHEYHCVLRNCRNNMFESVAYALRSTVARKLRFFHDHVTMFIALSQFARQRLEAAGFHPDRVAVLPNTVPCKETPVDPAAGSYIGFAGRLSPEKGIDTLLEAAARSPRCRLRLAGSGPLSQHARDTAANNVRLDGQLKPSQMQQFYRQARFLILPSRTYEMCPLVILEAISNGLPVITSRLGAQSELVADGVTGLLFEPGDAQDLGRKMRRLWGDPRMCRKMGRAAYELALSHSDEDLYFRRLMSIYRRAQEMMTRPEPLPSLPVLPDAGFAAPASREISH